MGPYEHDPLTKPAVAGTRDDTRPDLSIVVPIYNEGSVLNELFQRLEAEIEKLGIDAEIICVDDGSTNDVLDRLLVSRERNRALKIISLSRNFGKDIALSAGLEHSRGRAVIPIDADLQDPPELIGEMIERWRQGFDVVYATRRRRAGEGWIKRSTAMLFYRIFDRIAESPIPADTGDFRLLDRRVVDVLVKLPERTRFMKGLFSWVGFRQTAIHYDRLPRHGGKSGFNYWRLWNFALDGITAFSSLPLRIWSYLGLVISLGAFAYAIFLAALRLTRGIDVPGYTSLMVVVLFLGGVQLITLGVVGEYLTRVYNEVKGRPLYIVRERFGFEGDSTLEDVEAKDWKWNTRSM